MSYVAEQATAKAKYGVSHLQRQSAQTASLRMTKFTLVLDRAGCTGRRF